MAAISKYLLLRKKIIVGVEMKVTADVVYTETDFGSLSNVPLDFDGNSARFVKLEAVVVVTK